MMINVTAGPDIAPARVTLPSRAVSELCADKMRAVVPSGSVGDTHKAAQRWLSGVCVLNDAAGCVHAKQVRLRWAHIDSKPSQAKTLRNAWA